jgi:4-hydroxy-3-methylbut-2-enyl diphosphate reductase
MSDETTELQNAPATGGEETAVPMTSAVEGSVPNPSESSDANGNGAPESSKAASAAAALDTAQDAGPDLSLTSHEAAQGIEGEAVDYNRTFRALTEGDVIKGKVVHIDREGVLVDVGTKSEGLVPPQELSRGIPGAVDEPINVGDTIDVYVIEAEDQEGNPVLSKKRADFEKAWERVLEAKNDLQTLSAMVTDRVKGGLVVDLGIRGFIPASHVGNGRVRNLEQYIGQVLPLKVIEVDKERRKVVLSHRLATEEEREKQREETVSSLAEGQVRPGVVRRITDYGAFVDLGGIDGLLHISEMSWTRIKHPSEVVKVGDQIQVMVLKVNLDQNRVSLGLRQILPDPWTEVAARYNPGDVVQGVVSRLVPFGAFVTLDGGIEGIIPNSELSSKRVNKPDQVVKVGDEVEVKVKEVQRDERRIVLSKRELEAQKEQDQFREFTRERQQQPVRDQQRFTIGDALAAQLGDLARGGESEPSAERSDLTDTVENLAASPAEEARDSAAGGSAPAAGPNDFNPPADESAESIVGQAEAETALSDPAAYDDSVTPQGFARADQVAAEEAADAPGLTAPGAGGSGFLDKERTEESEDEAKNA